MLAPQWAHIRKASITRGGIEYRNAARKILLWENFCACADDVRRLQRVKILTSVKRVQEGVKYDQIERGDELMIFSGDGPHFAALQSVRGNLLGWLQQITRRRWLEIAGRYPDVAIGLNVRRGKDFVDAQQASDFRTKGALRTPLTWFVAALKRVREICGYPARAFVVSDGRREELAPLLNLPDVELVESDSAISDLLILSKSRVLIGSGGSSFSAWASFLSAAPTISHIGQSLQWFKVDPTGEQGVGEFDLEAGLSLEMTAKIKGALVNS